HYFGRNWCTMYPHCIGSSHCKHYKEECAKTTNRTTWETDDSRCSSSYLQNEQIVTNSKPVEDNSLSNIQKLSLRKKTPIVSPSVTKQTTNNTQNNNLLNFQKNAQHKKTPIVSPSVIKQKTNNIQKNNLLNFPKNAIVLPSVIKHTTNNTQNNNLSKCNTLEKLNTKEDFLTKKVESETNLKTSNNQYPIKEVPINQLLSLDTKYKSTKNKSNEVIFLAKYPSFNSCVKIISSHNLLFTQKQAEIIKKHYKANLVNEYAPTVKSFLEILKEHTLE
ncbi:MAG: hypothetical protein MR727_02010, partial [Lentisphaeria bacterium]|nr:hypothetical protein [Lentisphaeria bacterium]